MNAHDRRTSLLRAAALAERAGVIEPLWYPSYHAAPTTGWMNDPNGLCRRAGVTHLFYQYAPLTAAPGLNFWGHLATEDYLHYTRYPPALACDEAFDCHGVYSGSAVVNEDGIRLFYTGNVRNEAEGDGITAGRKQVTATCFSRDAVRFDGKRIVLSPDDYPGDISCHVRDPKVIPVPGGWDMLLGMRTLAGHGGLLVFHAASLTESWAVRARCEDTGDAYMWECPDLITADGGARFLSVCRQTPHGDTAAYCPVSEDYTITGGFRVWDSGPDFYAPQTFCEEDGRRVLLAWMGKPGSYEKGMNPESRGGWVHMMTLPRVLSLRDGVPVQRPHPALERLRLDAVPLRRGKMLTVSPCLSVVWEGEAAGNGNRNENSTFLLHLGALTVSVSDGMLCVDPGRWGCGRSAVTQPYPGGGLTVFMDKSSVEVFPETGPTVTMRVYPKDPLTIPVLPEHAAGAVLYPMDRLRCTVSERQIY